MPASKATTVEELNAEIAENLHAAYTNGIKHALGVAIVALRQGAAHPGTQFADAPTVINQIADGFQAQLDMANGVEPKEKGPTLWTP